jgi:hypothetical protein
LLLKNLNDGLKKKTLIGCDTIVNSPSFSY